MLRHATNCKQVAEHLDHLSRRERPGNLDRQAFPCELIDHHQHPQLAIILGAVLDEVVAPYMIGAQSVLPHTAVRAAATRRPTLLMLFLRHLHPFLSPEPFYSLVIDRPTSFAKRIVNPRAAKPRPLASNPPHLL